MSIEQIIQLCIVPILGILTKFLIDFLSAKRDELNAKTDSEIAKKYHDMIYETVVTCIIATNQTYVNSLKVAGSFNEEAQKEAFQKTMDAVLEILSEDAKQYIIETSGDLTVYLTNLIEKEVNINREAL